LRTGLIYCARGDLLCSCVSWFGLLSVLVYYHFHLAGFSSTSRPFYPSWCIVSAPPPVIFGCYIRPHPDSVPRRFYIDSNAQSFHLSAATAQSYPLSGVKVVRCQITLGRVRCTVCATARVSVNGCRGGVARDSSRCEFFGFVIISGFQCSMNRLKQSISSPLLFIC
jgi:hypothetical protein